MMTQISRPTGNRQGVAWKRRLALLVGVAGSLLACWTVAASLSNSTRAREPNTNGEVTSGTIDTKTSDTLTITSGTTNDVPYYHCDGTDQHIVLLHGTAFTKEDWKETGIMEQFCQSSKLSVSAVDLPVSAGYRDLQSLLTAMRNQGLVTLPVTLVTPSASGHSIVDWTMNGEVAEFPKYISKWIPVASLSVLHASDEQVKSLENALPIFAIYGDKDQKGKTATDRLGSSANAKTLELEGRHPVYLDSPNEFVTAVLQELGLSQ